MTDHVNAETLYKHYTTKPHRKNKINVCLARPNWTGCDFCDVYGAHTRECWKQDGPHKCVYVQEKTPEEIERDYKKRLEDQKQ